jgi:flagellar capping protein FliD
MNQYKSKLKYVATFGRIRTATYTIASFSTVTKALQQSEAAHKHTTAELTRTRSTLTSMRTAHQTELKKKEVQVERLQEKWSKLADNQTKLGGLRSGITCANLAVVEASAVMMHGKGQGYLDIALEHAEKARAELIVETTDLRRTVVYGVNSSQRIASEIRAILINEPAEEVC